MENLELEIQEIKNDFERRKEEFDENCVSRQSQFRKNNNVQRPDRLKREGRQLGGRNG